MQEAEPLQQLRRTYVRYRGKVLSYFGGCDYFRLASHPEIQTAVRTGLATYGLNVAASRMTTGNHIIYGKIEDALANFFGAESAVLTNSGYTTNLIVAQALTGQFTHTLIDERAHVALNDAAILMGAPVDRFKHRDVSDFERVLRRCGRNAKPLVLTDGMFAHNGSVAPLPALEQRLPSGGMIVVDDAHGAGTLGRTGGGTVEWCGVRRDRIIQNITLSKAFGVYGGAIICSTAVRQKILPTRMFVGSTPLPLPLANASLKAISWHRRSATARRRLSENAAVIKNRLRTAGMNLPEHPGPIIPVHFQSPNQNAALKSALLNARILPPFINYPGSPAGGYFRFVISSEHTKAQLAALGQCLTPFVLRMTR